MEAKRPEISIRQFIAGDDSTFALIVDEPLILRDAFVGHVKSGGLVGNPEVDALKRLLDYINNRADLINKDTYHQRILRALKPPQSNLKKGQSRRRSYSEDELSELSAGGVALDIAFAKILKVVESTSCEELLSEQILWRAHNCYEVELNNHKKELKFQTPEQLTHTPK
ncbi:MAG: hypothetical protein L6Q57_04385 [Alphaproteobacteria bacterium]|nr:hypothetical protein [Alphaproteobacteria bacterium]